jgi:hypothetical protein
VLDALSASGTTKAAEAIAAAAGVEKTEEAGILDAMATG